MLIVLIPLETEVGRFQFYFYSHNLFKVKGIIYDNGHKCIHGGNVITSIKVTRRIYKRLSNN